MQYRRLLLIIAAALFSAGQVVPAQAVTVPTAVAPARNARPWVNPIKDEHLKPLPPGARPTRSGKALAQQEPLSLAGRGGLQRAEQAATAQTSGNASIQFLTRPYTVWHNITS